jgi:hypothetical protein
MTRCIDISDNRKLGTISPIAMFVFVGCYIGLTAFMDFGILYFICVMVAYILTQLFFQFTPRYVWLTLKFLSTNAYLTPSFTDDWYIVDETRFSNIQRILPDIE